MNSSVRKYMLFDLFALAIIGFILEMLAVKFSAFVFISVPTTAISLLMIFVAVVRWNLWGLLICPVLALGTVVGGQQIEIPYLAAVYDHNISISGLAIFISAFVGLLTTGLNVITYKKNTGRIINSPWMMLVLIFNYIVFCIVQIAVYRLITAGTLLHGGHIIYQHIYYVKDDAGVLQKVVDDINLCYRAEGGLVYNLFGLAVLYVGAYVLRSQGVLCNAIQKLIDDRKNAELNRIDRKFKIEEADDVDSVGESQTSQTE